MNYKVFEQAAVEAAVGAKEIDAELERLKTRKEVLVTLMQHLSMALPMLAAEDESKPAIDKAEAAGCDESVPEARTGTGDWSNFVSGRVTPGMAESDAVLLADYRPQSTLQPLRATGVAVLSAADGRGIRERV